MKTRVQTMRRTPAQDGPPTSSMKTKTLVALAIVAGMVGVVASPASAASSTTDFEPVGFVPGITVHNRMPDGTLAVPPISGINPDAQAWSVGQAGVDEMVVDITGTDPAHGKVWRISDQAETGDLQNRPHAPQSGGFSGETTAIDDFGNETPTSNEYYARIDFRSATGAAQPGMLMDVTGACGDDCRHGYVRTIDGGDGLDLRLFDTGDNTGAGSCGTFVTHDADTNLSYGDWHTLEIEVTFIDGFAGAPGEAGNDVVDIWVDGTKVLSGTSWETCYAFTGSGEPRGIDRLAFSRASAGMSEVGGGLYFDNVMISDQLPERAATPASTEDCRKGGWQSLTDDDGRPFRNQGDCVSYVATGAGNAAAG